MKYIPLLLIAFFSLPVSAMIDEALARYSPYTPITLTKDQLAQLIKKNQLQEVDQHRSFLYKKIDGHLYKFFIDPRNGQVLMKYHVEDRSGSY